MVAMRLVMPTCPRGWQSEASSAASPGCRRRVRNPDLTLTLALIFTPTLALTLTLTLAAYWLALGGFAVAGGHEPSLHAGARVHCALEVTPNPKPIGL